MLDTHAIARSLTDAEFTQAQADAITNAVRQAVEQSDHVTSDQFKAGLAEVQTQIANLDKRLSTEIAEMRAEQRAEIAETRAEQRTEIAAVRTEIANLETRLIRWMVGTVTATATLTFGILRFLG